jgi:transcriptional regulator with XRE-family HTH domain
MAEFHRDKLPEFLSVVRKYMAVRGPMSQKELAELTDTGVSTMSRFLTMKTNDVNPQLVAKILAVLEIPLHEVIDFVEEDYADKFIRLVKFYKNDVEKEPTFSNDPNEVVGSESEQMSIMGESTGESPRPLSRSGGEHSADNDILGTLGTAGSAKKNVEGRIKIGGKSRSMPFESDDAARSSEPKLREKLESLSPRQKAYMTDFLNLDMEGRDLIVDIGNNLFRYFKHRGMEF